MKKPLIICDNCGAPILPDPILGWLHSDGGEACQPGFELFIRTYATPRKEAA
jgi:hypothetical protein